jgi:hypothetical protein
MGPILRAMLTNLFVLFITVSNITFVNQLADFVGNIYFYWFTSTENTPCARKEKNSIHILSTVSSKHEHRKKLTAHITHRMIFR